MPSPKSNRRPPSRRDEAPVSGKQRSSRVFARVKVTIEVELSQPWDGAETVDNVRRFATRDATEQLERYCQPVKGLRLVSVDTLNLHIVEDFTR